MSEPKPRIQLSCEQGAFAAYADAVTAAGGLPCPGYAPEPDLSCVGLVLWVGLQARRSRVDAVAIL